MKIILAFLFAIVTLHGFSQEPRVSSPKIVIKIPLGDSIVLEKHTIKFVKVLEDSRCPKDATCVWAGRAKVVVEISSEEKKTIQKEIIFGKVNPGESDDLQLFKNDDKKIISYQLNPYPTSENTADSNKYVLLIAVDD